jgi:BirA family transcriptional regulator, biotin operon repressor / biotin---[acetyl-CoA-carboxylase] ligase
MCFAHAALADFMEADLLTSFFEELARSGSAPLAAWPIDEDLEVYGLQRVGDSVEPLVAYDPLCPVGIRAALTPPCIEWLSSIEVWPVIGSTNAELMRRAQTSSINGCVCLAEIQTQGRGRRGRAWYSPFGANLAASIGLAMSRPASTLGGASLVVGLAVVDALDRLGVPDIALKWPNDVLLAGAKVGGILIEMLQLGSQVQLVVGIGLNVSLPQQLRTQLEQEVADLVSSGFSHPRDRLAATVVSSVVEFMVEFDRSGFQPFIEAFNERHYYQGRQVQVLQGESRISGEVRGVSDGGALLLQTPSGLAQFHGGEVSLRQS